MEATSLSSLKPFILKPNKLRRGRLPFSQMSFSLRTNEKFMGRRTPAHDRHFLSRSKREFSIFCSLDQSLPLQSITATSVGGQDMFSLQDINGSATPQPESKTYRNRFLNLVRISSVLNNAAESFFKGEIRRRLFVTAALIVVSRLGYFIPLPGFDRRLIPQDYLSFGSASVDELGNLATELKLSFFQLGISPQIIASIIMQVLCHVVPTLVKLRKEGLDGHEKIKSYIWWISLGFAILQALIVSYSSLQYSIYAASNSFKHVMVTTLLLVCGAMTMTWICDTISESGFGQGSSLIICVGILTGYKDTLFKMLSQLSGTVASFRSQNFTLDQNLTPAKFHTGIFLVPV